MGCVSSKLARTEVKREHSDKCSRSISLPNHVVALTSSTYGVLRVDSSPLCAAKCRGSKDQGLKSLELSIQSCSQMGKWMGNENPQDIMEDEPETINAWELMEGLDDEGVGGSPAKKSLEKNRKSSENSAWFVHTVEELDSRVGKVSGSILSGDKSFGKENMKPVGVPRVGCGSKEVLRPSKEVLRPVKFNNINNNAFNAVGLNEASPRRGFSKRSPAKGGNLHYQMTPDNVVSQKVCRSGSNGGSMASRQASRFVSHGALTDLRVASARLNSKLRLSVDRLKEPNSPLFDPDLLASFEKALENLSEEDWNAIRRTERDRDAGESPAPCSDLQAKKKMKNPLENFEERCPPGGDKGVVLYTTTLRGIRKTFEDCNSVRCVLESFGLCYSERDVSMHLEFRNELKVLMGKLVTVPRLFIKGRYIGGAEEVLKMHEEDKLGELVEGLPTDMARKICDGCGGVRFVPCLECSGSCKLVNEDKTVVRCPECNENGLIQCPICC